MTLAVTGVLKPSIGRTRRVLLSYAILGVRGRIQRETEVVHLVARELTDLSAELASVGNRETPFPLPHGRGDEAHHGGSGIDPRGMADELASSAETSGRFSTRWKKRRAIRSALDSRRD
jgi:hypothetical protein